MSKIINAGKGIFDLAGVQLKDENEVPLTVGKMMGGALMQAQGGDDVKLYLLSIKLREKDKVELDVADFKTLKNGVDALRIPRLTKAQFIMVLDEAKDKPEKAK